ncbi:MAG TPA: DinB family protein [Longimicrobium sp.]|nr:DinB family protein [Longimicrobium sp.]
MTTTTAAPTFDRPAADEHAPYYARYIDLVPDGDLLDYLQRQMESAAAFLRAIPAEKHGHRYAEGKWSVREMVGHIADTERIFAYRALRFARADQTPLAGFDENAYVPAANFDARDLDSLVDEWVHVRLATLALLRGLDAGAPLRRGKANDQEISVRALAWVTAGHVDHHAAILRERYLGES